MAWLMGTKILLNNTEPNESDYRLKSIHDIDDPNGFDHCFSWSMNDLPTAYNGVNDYDDSKDDWDSYKDWSNDNLDSMSNSLDNFLRFKYYTHQTYTQHNKVVLADGTIIQGTDGEAALVKKDGVYKFYCPTGKIEGKFIVYRKGLKKEVRANIGGKSYKKEWIPREK